LLLTAASLGASYVFSADISQKIFSFGSARFGPPGDRHSEMLIMLDITPIAD
jgi:hypothetical protein